MQTGQFNSPITALTSTLHNEGLLAFYKGTLAPLFGVGACVSIQFYGFHEAKRQLLSLTPGRKELSLTQVYIAGSFAGIVNTPITAPVEQVRILLQVQKGTGGAYSGPRDAINKIIKEKGVVRGFFRGTGITLAREAQAYGMWFLTYEWLMRSAINWQNIERKDVPTWQLLLFGATAGEILWLSSYPLDVIKSKIQSDSFGKNSKYNAKIWKVVEEIRKTEGMRGFWKGIGPTLARAIPCSAATFTTVETILRLLE